MHTHAPLRLRARTSAVLLTLLALVAVGLVTAPAGAAARLAGTKVTGTWRGMVSQEGISEDYPARVRIFRNDAGRLRGRITYPDVCSGVWKFRVRENGWRKFTEIITDDPGEVSCVPRLRVKVKRVDAKLRVVWTHDGTKATMLARRV